MAAICTRIICSNGQQVHYFFARGRFPGAANVAKTEHEIRFCWTKPPTQWDCFHNSHLVGCQRGRCASFFDIFFVSRTNFWPGFVGAGDGQPNAGGSAKAAETEEVLKFSFCQKTSKIIFIPFSITLSPCVFWSQQDSPPLLSPYSRWRRHTEGKSVLALARSNATMRKRLHFLGWGWSFFLFFF